ncbi:MAG: hypothetical protein NTW38_02210 [Candidatus Aminicenantes bacterium]|nr:hypothetical protein [Candidatus Aminicenantes bacterium]
MFQTVALKKTGALMCLGFICLAVPGWGVAEEPIRPNSPLQFLRDDLMISLTPIFFSEHMYWIFKRIEPSRRDEGNTGRMKPKDDIGIVKISISD